MSAVTENRPTAVIPPYEMDYLSCGSVVELTTEQGQRITDAQVLVHDPVHDFILVRCPAASGRDGLFDVSYFHLYYLRELIPQQRNGKVAPVKQPPINVEKVQSRLRRSAKERELKLAAAAGQ